MRTIFLVMLLTISHIVSAQWLPTGGGTLTGNLELYSSAPSVRINGTNNLLYRGIEFGNGSNIDGFIKQLPISGELQLSAGRYSGWGGFHTFYTDLTERMRITPTGNVGIGTSTPDSKLTVAGNIHAREVKVTTAAGADFVFDDEYKLWSLAETEAFIKQHKHLPEIAPARDMIREGINLSEMNIKLLQKIEELTLYLIDSKKDSEQMKKEIRQQVTKVKDLEQEITKLKSKR